MTTQLVFTQVAIALSVPSGSKVGSVMLVALSIPIRETSAPAGVHASKDFASATLAPAILVAMLRVSWHATRSFVHWDIGATPASTLVPECRILSAAMLGRVSRVNSELEHVSVKEDIRERTAREAAPVSQAPATITVSAMKLLRHAHASQDSLEKPVILYVPHPAVFDAVGTAHVTILQPEMVSVSATWVGLLPLVPPSAQAVSQPPVDSTALVSTAIHAYATVILAVRPARGVSRVSEELVAIRYVFMVQPLASTVCATSTSPELAAMSPALECQLETARILIALIVVAVTVKGFVCGTVFSKHALVKSAALEGCAQAEECVSMALMKVESVPVRPTSMAPPALLTAQPRTAFRLSLSPTRNVTPKAAAAVKMTTPHTTTIYSAGALTARQRGSVRLVASSARVTTTEVAIRLQVHASVREISPLASGMEIVVSPVWMDMSGNFAIV